MRIAGFFDELLSASHSHLSEIVDIPHHFRPYANRVSIMCGLNFACAL